MMSQVALFNFTKVIRLVISHDDNVMAVMRFTLDRTKANKRYVFQTSVCLQTVIYYRFQSYFNCFVTNIVIIS